MTQWERNANTAEDVYGAYIDWEERFYICPNCEEPIYEDDWDERELVHYICPICEFTDEEEE